MLDGGDFLNSSQSLRQQKEVIGAMNKMGYHAATPGNNELSHGQAHFAALIPLMHFTMVNCNYEFSGELSNLIKSHLIVYSGEYKIGVTGVGHQLKGIKYNDAILCANNEAALLKIKEKCDLIVCLSHLGFSQDGDQPDNQKLAQQSEYIDIIVSGHNRNLLSGPSILLNKLKKEVIVSHAAWDGLMAGKTTFCYTNGKQKSAAITKYIVPGRLSGQTLQETFTGHHEIEKYLITA
ncbi:MAG: metallophosphoesterase [Sphingobacteriales bacterium]